MPPQGFRHPAASCGNGFPTASVGSIARHTIRRDCEHKDIALRVGNPEGVRAVAQAVGANGIAIFIPCHRVVGSNHSLTGFAGGLEAKRMLLEIENKNKTKIL